MKTSTALFRVFLAVVVLAPLPLGAVQPWAWTLMGCAVGALLLWWAVLAVSGRAGPGISPARLRPAILCFVLAAGWAAAQTLSVTPPGLHHPVWTEAANALATPLPGAISVDPFETGSALLRLLTYAGVLFLAFMLCREGVHARRALIAVIVSGTCYAVYGLVLHLSGSDLVLWFHKVHHAKYLTSTFVNRNSYATLAGLGLICVSALLLRRFATFISPTESSRRKFFDYVEAFAGWGIALVLVWAVLFTALLLTGSRAGLAATILAHLALLLGFAFGREISMRPILAAMVGVAAVGLIVVFVSVGATAGRFVMIGEDWATRAAVYERTLDAIEEEPWVGTGFGSFEQVFRTYRTEAIRGNFDKAHSTYLENALELGIPAAALLCAGILFLFVRCCIGLRRRRQDAHYACIGMAATVLVAVHSLVDFSLQIPAVAATWALLLGIGTAQSWRRTDA